MIYIVAGNFVSVQGIGPVSQVTINGENTAHEHVHDTAVTARPLQVIVRDRMRACDWTDLSITMLIRLNEWDLSRVAVGVSQWGNMQRRTS